MQLFPPKFQYNIPPTILIKKKIGAGSFFLLLNSCMFLEDNKKVGVIVCISSISLLIF